MFDPEVIVPKIKSLKKYLKKVVFKRKKLFIGIAIVFLFFLGAAFIKGKRAKTSASIVKSVKVNIDKGFEFPALDNQGKDSFKKIKFKIEDAEKTNQVAVKDQVFTAKNNKVFLIVNLELKNDETKPYNILPGDLVRVTYNSDEESKFAPDLHNNLVSVAAISTKIDRIGFVIPEQAKEFKFYIGELEGKKEIVSISFPS